MLRLIGVAVIGVFCCVFHYIELNGMYVYVCIYIYVYIFHLLYV
jgi:hypothetical protein